MGEDRLQAEYDLIIAETEEREARTNLMNTINTFLIIISASIILMMIIIVVICLRVMTLIG